MNCGYEINKYNTCRRIGHRKTQRKSCHQETESYLNRVYMYMYCTCSYSVLCLLQYCTCKMFFILYLLQQKIVQKITESK